MTEATPPAAPRLWTREGFRDDEWSHAESAEALSGNGRFILPLQAFLDLDLGVRAGSRERLGVILQPGEHLENITEFLGDLSLVALAFPAFSDGRSYSKAELLRGRHGFAGIVRATGEVLVDQLPHMLRTGFDQFEISHPVLLRRLEAGDSGGIPFYYQPTAKPADAPAKGAAYSWRRQRQAG
ncbi:DUF934 domain-containing protein [Corticibacterium sp. UT-5YL-CI-8]|nr:DUF934 domain-containing protein [Tianweitania sp. UT-5YL-CI-8]